MVFTIDTLKFIVTYNAGTSMWLLEIEFSYSFGVMLWLKWQIITHSCIAKWGAMGYLQPLAKTA